MEKRAKVVAGGFLFLLVLGAIIGPVTYVLTRDKSSATYEKAAVATDAPKCSEIGDSILSKSGSAVDAAIAAMFCVGIINLHSVGIGGGGVMLVYNRRNRAAEIFDYRETAPESSTPDMFVGKGDQSRKGGLSIAVPGEVRGQYEAWGKYGKLPWKQLVQPAIDLAKNGFEINKPLSEAMTKAKEAIKSDAGLRELLMDGDKLRKQGDDIINLKYAKTLETIRDDPGSFYNGPLANNIVADMNTIGGRVVSQDLNSYTAVPREPLESKLAGLTMYLTPPPTSGPVLALILNILAGYNMTSSSRDGKSASALTYHRIIEAFKFAYAWRSRLGDPHSRFGSTAKIAEARDKMMNPGTGAWLRRKISDSTTQKDVKYYADFYSDAEYGTTHVTVLAENGDAVSVTSTINNWFGSKYRSTSTGIIYNNEMADFDNPDDKKVDGISPSPFNYPDSRKRPFSSISPAILTDDKGDVRLVIGASGGKKITTAVSLVLMNKVWFGRSLSDAVDDPRVHTELVPNQDVVIEEKPYRISDGIQKGLRDRDHIIKESNLYAAVQAISQDVLRKIDAKSDPRKSGEPAGH